MRRFRFELNAGIIYFALACIALSSVVVSVVRMVKGQPATEALLLSVVLIMLAEPGLSSYTIREEP